MTAVTVLLGEFIFFLLLSLGTAAPLTAENDAWNINRQTRHSPKDYYGEWDDHEYFPSPRDWREIPLYQLVTDRFADGDPRNNELYPRDFDIRDMTYRHGGDFRGLKDHLSYIKGTGCLGIWISPIFQNGPNSYHQYAQEDFTLLDRRLGTLEELRELVAAAHAIGIYVIIDVVMNHMSNRLNFAGTTAGAPFGYHEDEYELEVRNEDELIDTPVGPQPYADFWYNNTWDANWSYGEAWDLLGIRRQAPGLGSYSYSDFHHNGDLTQYEPAFITNMGKIYGIMDDLRLGHERVMEKYIAMTKALMSSTDVDGFRVDTPMQVPLSFFKAWAPAMRDHARSLGKEKFLLFGEFFVELGRYATMTGRGREAAQYGTAEFLEGPATLKGGICYGYYWIMVSAVLFNESNLMGGHWKWFLDYETSVVDFTDPITERFEYSMLNFCNNHDQWRLQVKGGENGLKTCLTAVTFWPGIPLHYVGDEQLLDTPGIALDGWAREELAASLAWTAITGPDGSAKASKDNFDMTAPFYRFLQRMNTVRAQYLTNFTSDDCDRARSPYTGVKDVLTFARGCDIDSLVLVVANFDRGQAHTVSFRQGWWPDGTVLEDVAVEQNASQVTVLDGIFRYVIGPMSAAAFVQVPVRPIPVTVVAVWPRHAAVVASIESIRNITISFDRPMDQAVLEGVRLDGIGGNFNCRNSDCREVVADVDVLSEGFHKIEVDQGLLASDGSTLFAPFISSFIFAPNRSPISDPAMHDQPGLICQNFTMLCHFAPGAQWVRASIVGENWTWTDWIEYDVITPFDSEPGRPVVVQYHAEGSAAYVVGDCISEFGERCLNSWHDELHLRGDANGWQATAMSRVRDFTWGLNVTLSGYERYKLSSHPELWDQYAYGIQALKRWVYGLPIQVVNEAPNLTNFTRVDQLDGTEWVRDYMLTNGFWDEHTSLMSGMDGTVHAWISPLCQVTPPPCQIDMAGDDALAWGCVGQSEDVCTSRGSSFECYDYAVNDGSEEYFSCGCPCCRRPSNDADLGGDGETTTCCLLFNDLYLNYSVVEDLSECAPLHKGWLEGYPDPPDQVAVEEQGQEAEGASASIQLRNTWSAIICWICTAPLIGFPLMAVWWWRMRKVIRVTKQLTVEEVDGPNKYVSCAEMPKTIFVASLEHLVLIPEEHIVLKVVAGGLGKVAGLMAQYHPGDFISMHPCMHNEDYSFAKEVSTVSGVVCGETIQCKVLKAERMPAESDVFTENLLPPPRVTYYFVDHPMFRNRYHGIYPTPMTSKAAIAFYSLWNQCVGNMINRLQPDLFHCPDFHNAMAVLYVDRPLKVMCTLHNAEYQGIIQSQHMGKDEVHAFADVFNLDAKTVKGDCMTDGGFNLLKPIVKFAKTFQKGYGFCTVSRTYALEAMQKHQVLWPLPKLRGLENCMPEVERPKLTEDGAVLEHAEWERMHREAKIATQENFNMTVDPDAKVFVFLGRWVKQKGMDYIADVAEWMLDKYDDIQLYMMGPVGDSFGSYAREKLHTIVESKKYEGRLFVYAGFLVVPKELKLATDFCLMPSRDEPFGYVDIEFGWFGALTVGGFKGGLGKVPGFYYQIANADSDEHVQASLRRAIAEAMACDEESLQEMRTNARRSFFPIRRWQDEIRDIYAEVSIHFNPAGTKKQKWWKCWKRGQGRQPRKARKLRRHGMKCDGLEEEGDLEEGDLPADEGEGRCLPPQQDVSDFLRENAEQRLQQERPLVRFASFHSARSFELDMIPEEEDRSSSGAGDIGSPKVGIASTLGTSRLSDMKPGSRREEGVSRLRTPESFVCRPCAPEAGCRPHRRNHSRSPPKEMDLFLEMEPLGTDELPRMRSLRPEATEVSVLSSEANSSHYEVCGPSDYAWCSPRAISPHARRSLTRSPTTRTSSPVQNEDADGIMSDTTDFVPMPFRDDCTSSYESAVTLGSNPDVPSQGVPVPAFLAGLQEHPHVDRNGAPTANPQECVWCIAARAEMLGEPYCLPVGLHFWTSEASRGSTEHVHRDRLGAITSNMGDCVFCHAARAEILGEPYTFPAGMHFWTSEASRGLMIARGGESRAGSVATISEGPSGGSSFDPEIENTVWLPLDLTTPTDYSDPWSAFSRQQGLMWADGQVKGKGKGRTSRIGSASSRLSSGTAISSSRASPASPPAAARVRPGGYHSEGEQLAQEEMVRMLLDRGGFAVIRSEDPSAWHYADVKLQGMERPRRVRGAGVWGSEEGTHRSSISSPGSVFPTGFTDLGSDMSPGSSPYSSAVSPGLRSRGQRQRKNGPLLIREPELAPVVPGERSGRLKERSPPRRRSLRSRASSDSQAGLSSLEYGTSEIPDMSMLEMEDTERRATAPSLQGSREAAQRYMSGASWSSDNSVLGSRRRRNWKKHANGAQDADEITNSKGRHSDDAEASWSQKSGVLSVISSMSDLSALEMSSQSQSTVYPIYEYDRGSEMMEYWEQEPTDEVLQVLVEGKLAKRTHHGRLRFQSANAVMQAVQWDLNIERETTHVSRFLSRPFFDTCRIDWVICLTYISGPVCSALFMGPCCSAASTLYEPATTVFAVWAWTLAARWGRRPNRTMAVVMLSRFLTVIPAYIEMPLWLSGILLGFSVSGDVLFVYFAFMGRSFGDVSQLGWRTGLLLSLRQLMEWLFYSVSSTPDEWMPYARVAAIIFCILLPSYCLLKAPRVYRKFPLPTTQKQFLRGIHPGGRCRVLLYLGASSILKSSTRISGEAGFIEWRMRQEHTFLTLAPYRLVAGGTLFLSVFLLGCALIFCYDISQTMIKGFACLSLAPVAIRCAVMLEFNVSTFAESSVVDLVTLFSYALESAQTLGTTMAVIAVVGSRWRMCVFVAFITCLSGVTRAGNALHLTFRMQEEFPLQTTQSKEVLARNLVMVAIVPLVCESILRIFSIFYYDQEASAMLWTKRQRRICRMFDKISFKKRKGKQHALLQPILEPVSLLLDARDELMEGEVMDVAEAQEHADVDEEAGALGLMTRASGRDVLEAAAGSPREDHESVTEDDEADDWQLETV